ncbi:hypothetical protein BS50DRAFT_573209 [Corynespora cassiicola Philippines]|uniref:Uncharacterized protein n=1 Tax=Corynespora cassiicola Philippines TaxID=1448308 RepID=A0A2T2NS64_CORCC|nr:hypothetical protein BS50DRAFT_573209 [Corynespora cassiicola Philippines]
MEPISGSFAISGVFAGINTLFKFGEYALRLAEVDDETGVFIRMIDVVRDDLRESERLLSLKHIHESLVRNRPKYEWVKKSLNNTRWSLSDIGKWVERARMEKETKRIEFKTRVLWVIKDHEKVVTRTKQLSVCHQQLSSVLACLVPLDNTGSEHHKESASGISRSDLRKLPDPLPPIAPPTYEAVMSSSQQKNIPTFTSGASLPYPDDFALEKTAVSMPFSPLEPGFKTAAEVYEYRCPSLEFSIAELEGDNCMGGFNESGLNSLHSSSDGTGQPTELHREPRFARSSRGKREDLSTLSELLGDLPTENSANTPAPPPDNSQYRPRHMSSPELHNDSKPYRPRSYRAPPRPSLPILPKDIASLPSQASHQSKIEPAAPYEGSPRTSVYSQNHTPVSPKHNGNSPIPFPVPFSEYQYLAPIPPRKPRQYRSSTDAPAHLPSLRAVSSFSSFSSYDTLNSSNLSPNTLSPVQCYDLCGNKVPATSQVSRQNSRMRNQKSYMNMLENLNGPSIH